MILSILAMQSVSQFTRF